MMNRQHAWVVAIVLAATTSVGRAQSFNIDIGLDSGPPDSYAAAGYAGHWISVPGTQGVTVSNLVDVHGDTTSAQFNQIGGTETLSLIDPAVTGDDAVLMNDALITHSTVENCMFFSSMLPGKYAILIYARMPNEPGVLAVTNVDQQPGNSHLLVGGLWPGDHAEGISFSRHIADVAAIGAQTGRLGLHSGVPSGGNFTIGAALNGIQITRLSDADFDSNGAIDGDDVDLLVAEIVAGTSATSFDLTGDGLVDNHDLNQWLSYAGNANLPSGNPYLPGDANLDGTVDGEDFIAWNSNKFTPAAAWTAGDLNADGLVDGLDFIVWNAFKFQSASSPSSAVPEPSIGILFVGVLVCCRNMK